MSDPSQSGHVRISGAIAGVGSGEKSHIILHNRSCLTVRVSYRIIQGGSMSAPKSRQTHSYAVIKVAVGHGCVHCY